ncbi:MAG: hypothetical protein KKA07_18610 [Bacteroidetes bacterium]|nr:hypothetical protein [Bacteroidota bacterium]MBU1721084.1 hypothetical protein [Bacteroidota bacterium]
MTGKDQQVVVKNGVKILIIEDNCIISLALKNFFAVFGYECIIANSIQRGNNLLHSSRFHVVIAECAGSTTELLETLQLCSHEGIPVLLSTQYAHLSTLRGKGVSLFLKPYNLLEMKNMLEIAVKNSPEKEYVLRAGM